MNLKKTLLAFSALVTLASSRSEAMDMQPPSSAMGDSLSLAATSSASQSPFKAGFGIGAFLGYGSQRAKFQTFATLPAAGALPARSFYGQGKACESGLLGGFSVDYQSPLNNSFLVGVGLNVPFEAHSVKRAYALQNRANNDSVATEVKRTYALEPVFLIGRKVGAKFLVSLYGGPSFGSFKVAHDDVGDPRTPVNKRTGSAVGFVAGLKVGYALTSKIVASLSLDYTRYPKFNLTYGVLFLSASPAGVVPTPGQTHTGTVRYAAFTPKLSVTYRF